MPATTLGGRVVAIVPAGRWRAAQAAPGSSQQLKGPAATLRLAGLGTAGRPQQRAGGSKLGGSLAAHLLLPPRGGLASPASMTSWLGNGATPGRHELAAPEGRDGAGPPAAAAAQAGLPQAVEAHQMPTADLAAHERAMLAGMVELVGPLTGWNARQQVGS